MKNDNYKVYLADDHNGNKFLMILKGNGEKAMKHTYTITDKRFNDRKEKLIDILEHTAINTKQ